MKYSIDPVNFCLDSAASRAHRLRRATPSNRSPQVIAKSIKVIAPLTFLVLAATGPADAKTDIPLETGAIVRQDAGSAIVLAAADNKKSAADKSEKAGKKDAKAKDKPAGSETAGTTTDTEKKPAGKSDKKKDKKAGKKKKEKKS
jgi:hypothetical protein